MESLTTQLPKKFPRHVDFLTKWLKFTKYNSFIEGVNIIPFKCPLDKKYNEYIDEVEYFQFEYVYDYSLSIKKPITDIIDLTFTDKYYNPKQGAFVFLGITHHKFMIPGKNIPKPAILNEILDTMDELIKNDKVIGIHCTHGINRTGYIVCCYLVKRLGWEPANALAAFKNARGFPLEHQDYIDAVLALNNPEKSESESNGSPYRGKFYNTRKKQEKNKE